MERVETLLKKLQEQFVQNAPAEQLLLTVHMLQVELLHLQAANAPAFHTQNIEVTVSQNNFGIPHQAIEKSVANDPIEEKIIEILQVDDAAIEAELEEIKRTADLMNKISVQNKPSILFETETDDDIPTLSHQRPVYADEKKKEINEVAASGTASVNERLKQTKIDLGDDFTEVPIRDLKKAIGVNDRYLFINELFRGDEAAYERSIKTINSFSILPEAEYWIQRELKVKNGWRDSDLLVRQFYQLVKRRFT